MRRSSCRFVLPRCANAAFRQAFELARVLGLSLKVFFFWQDNAKAAYPNQGAAFEL